MILHTMRKALPEEVQIIVSSHSPFVISSCRGARVHILDVDERGRAFLKTSVEAPFGYSVAAMLRDIFSVSSEFDVETERDLKEWNELKKKQAARVLNETEDARLRELTGQLAARNEELRLIVTTPPRLNEEFLKALVDERSSRPKRKTG